MKYFTKSISLLFLILMTSKVWSLPKLSEGEHRQFARACNKEIRAELNKPRNNDFFGHSLEFIFAPVGRNYNRLDQRRVVANLPDSYRYYESKLIKLTYDGATVRTAIIFNYVEKKSNAGWTKPELVNKNVIFECIFIDVEKGLYPSPNMFIEYENGSVHVKFKRYVDGKEKYVSENYLGEFIEYGAPPLNISDYYKTITKNLD